jgi:chlorite dismutase
MVVAAPGQWVLRLNNAPVHIAAFLCKWPAKHNTQVLSHHRYSLNIAHADLVLFLKVKDHLDDITLTQDTLKSTWERAIRTLNTKKFAAAYRR